jgi:hypothetical protein
MGLVLLYALYKAQGCYVQPWQPGVALGAHMIFSADSDSNSCARCAPMRMKTGSLRPRGGSAPPARTRCALRRSAPT